MKKTYIKPKTRNFRIYLQHALLVSGLQTDKTDNVRAQWSQKKDNGADIWSGNISWGYDADE